ncbi:hypothetical protein HN51_053069 [Arachis hypogaea]|nr:uncharacterized protein DS421_17g601740 [Arachis hypogaea]
MKRYYPSSSSVVLFTWQIIVLVLMVLLCISSWHVEGSRLIPHSSLPFNGFMVAHQAYSGPSRAGRGHQIIT